MKRLTIVATGVLAVLLVAAPVSGAGPISGDTTVPEPQTAGNTIMVEATVTSVVPVVPFEYSIQNECSFPGKSGSSYQRDDIVYWTDEEPGVPHTVMPIYLQSVPTGSKCKVFLMRNNTQVKGSVTSYTVD
jgi:hypothetical protein